MSASIDLATLELRELQTETARALSVMPSDNHALSNFNKLAPHNSQEWYKVILRSYIEQYGGLPSTIGPGKDIKLIQGS